MLHTHSKLCYNLAQDRNKKVVRLHEDEYTVLYIHPCNKADFQALNNFHALECRVNKFEQASVV